MKEKLVNMLQKRFCNPFTKTQRRPFNRVLLLPWFVLCLSISSFERPLSWRTLPQVFPFKKNSNSVTLSKSNPSSRCHEPKWSNRNLDIFLIKSSAEEPKCSVSWSLAIHVFDWCSPEFLWGEASCIFTHLDYWEQFTLIWPKSIA